MKNIKTFNTFNEKSRNGFKMEKIHNHFLEIIPHKYEHTFIVEGHISENAYITYVLNLTGKEAYTESMEYYTGPNYKTGASGKNHSRHYKDIPAAYFDAWYELKKYAMENFPLYYSEKLNDLNKKTGIFL
jgi:hypothetical protein